MTLPREPLWDFALRLYSAPDVQARALSLQKTQKLNISILLWLAWCWRHDIAMSSDAVKQALATIEQTHESLVLNLRQLRQQLDDDDASIRFGGTSLPESDSVTAQLHQLRQMILSAEIQAERVVLAQLESFTQVSLSGGVLQRSSAEIASFYEYGEWIDLSRGDAGFFERAIAHASVQELK